MSSRRTFVAELLAPAGHDLIVRQNELTDPRLGDEVWVAAALAPLAARDTLTPRAGRDKLAPGVAA